MTGTQRKNLVIVRAGDQSLHPGWLQQPERDFDIFISYYGSERERYASDAEHYEMRPGSKWGGLAQLLEERTDLLEHYQAFWFPDDDLDATTATVNRMFALVCAFDLVLAQPALTRDSHYSFSILLQRSEYVLRHVRFVEVMAPLFNRAALRTCCKTFGESASGWGLDWVWPSLLNGGTPERIAVLDAAPVKHTRPIGSGDLYARNPELKPRAEMEALLERYGLSGAHVESRYRFDGGIGRVTAGAWERGIAAIRTWYDRRRFRRRQRRKTKATSGA